MILNLNVTGDCCESRFSFVLVHVVTKSMAEEMTSDQDATADSLFTPLLITDHTNDILICVFYKLTK